MKPIDPRLARYASATKVYLALAVVLGVTLTGLVIAQASLLSAIIAGVFLGGETLPMVWPAMASLLAVFVARALVVWAGEAAGELAAVRVKSQLRLQLTHKLLALGPAFLDDQRSGELVTTATRGIDALDAFFARYLPQLVLGCLAPLALVVWVFRLDPLSAVILAVTVPLIPIFMILIGLEAQRRTQRQWQFLGRLSSHFLDVLQGLPTLRVFGRGRAQVSILRQITDQYRQATMGVLRVAFLSSLVLELIATLGTAVVAVSIGLRLLDGSIGLTEGLTILILAPEIYLPLRQVGVQFHASMEGNEAAQRIFQVLEAPLPERSVGLLPTPDLGQAEIHFRCVSFSYPTRPVPGPARTGPAHPTRRARRDRWTERRWKEHRPLAAPPLRRGNRRGDHRRRPADRRLRPGGVAGADRLGAPTSDVVPGNHRREHSLWQSGRRLRGGARGRPRRERARISSRPFRTRLTPGLAKAGRD